MAKTTKKQAGTKKAIPASTYNSLNNFLIKNERKVFLTIFFSSIILALLSFNARISEGNDDAGYIYDGWRYVHEFPHFFRTANAPLYSMFLALLTLIFGTRLIIFKLFSFLFFVIAAVMYYKILDKRVPAVLKFFVLIFMGINYLMIYYASMTYTEMFYLALQSVFLYYFCKYNFGDNPIGNNLKVYWKQWCVLGLLMAFLILSRNALVFGVAAIALFYLLKKDYPKVLISLATFGLFSFLLSVIKTAIWGESASQYKFQSGLMMNKSPYDPSLGKEDLMGFVTRFFDNIEIYLGKRFYQILGFMNEETLQGNYLLALIVIVLTFYGLYVSIKRKDHFLSFVILFGGTISMGTFIVLQAAWDQPRLIMVHMPFILLGMFYGLYFFFEKSSFNQKILVALLIIVSGSIFISSARRAIQNVPIVTRNLKGDIYYGYTPDWQNYLRCSAWCGDSLPKESLVACRKAPMSFMYAKGKEFFPVYNVIKRDSTGQSNPDSVLAYFKKNKVTHVMLGSLRTDPKRNTGGIINTVHNVVQPIMVKYPSKLKLIHTEGFSEETYVFEITY